MHALVGLVSAVPAHRLLAGRDIFGNGAALAAPLAAGGILPSAGPSMAAGRAGQEAA